MSGLWADGWFYISSAGLLVSGTLFFFLLGQYRAASEAADVTEAEQGADKEASAPAAIRPVYTPEAAPAAQVASHPDKPEAKPEQKPKAEGEYAGPERRRDAASATGGISPAVVYLQNIKGELTELHQEMRALAKRVDDELASVSTRDEALIERLGELARAVDGLKSAPSAAETPAAAPKKPSKIEDAPEPAVEAVLEAPAPAAPEPISLEVAAPEPKPETAPSPDETIRMELGAIIAPPVRQVPASPEPAQEPAPEAPAPEEKPRRGPVWPV